MARLLVEIEEELKRDLKIRLIREGETLKSWLTRMARAYVDGGMPARAPATRPMRVSRPHEEPRIPPVPASRTVSMSTTTAAPPAGPTRTDEPPRPKAPRFDDYLD
jgi:hypothetical protein